MLRTQSVCSLFSYCAYSDLSFTEKEKEYEAMNLMRAGGGKWKRFSTPPMLHFTFDIATVNTRISMMLV